MLHLDRQQKLLKYCSEKEDWTDEQAMECRFAVGDEIYFIIRYRKEPSKYFQLFFKCLEDRLKRKISYQQICQELSSLYTPLSLIQYYILEDYKPFTVLSDDFEDRDMKQFYNDYDKYRKEQKQNDKQPEKPKELKIVTKTNILDLINKPKAAAKKKPN